MADQGVPMLGTQTELLLKSPDPGCADEPQMEPGAPEHSPEKEQGAEAAVQQASSLQLAMEEENGNPGMQSLVDQEEDKVEGEEEEKVDEKEENAGKRKERADEEEEKADVRTGQADAEEEKMDEDEDQVDGEEEDEDAADHDFSELLQEVMRLLSPEKGGRR